MFEVLTQDGGARRGELTLPHGKVQTPVFQAVGTYGTVKAMTPKDLRDVGTQMLLGNTFHLMLRPGDERIRDLGGLHEFMQWDGPILTDSGGFQVFSLGDLRKMTEHSVVFRSPVNGDRVELTPESSIQVQGNLGSDVVMSSMNAPRIQRHMPRLKPPWSCPCAGQHDAKAPLKKNVTAV
jgi:queuine tRNA-ribosyltransferase